MAKGFNDRVVLAQQDAKRTRFKRRVALVLTVLVVALLAAFALAKQTVVEFENGTEQDYSLSVESGFSLALFNRIIAVDKSALISVSSFGYITQTIDMQSVPRGKYIPVYMPLAPVDLLVESSLELESPSWLVDGKWLGSEQTLNTRIKPGEYELTLSSAFTQDTIAEVSVPIGQDTQLTLSPNLIQGSLSIDSSPTGARVLVNDEERGVTPLTLDLTGGRYAIELRRDQYVSQFETIEISALSPKVERDYRLLLGTNGVRLQLQPQGGQLLVNDRLRSAAPQIQVPNNGELKLEYRKDGYRSKAVSVSSQDTSVSISLEKSYGQVVIESDVSAEVFINGAPRGTTPLSLDLQTLSYDIVLKASGFVDAQKRVTVEENQTLKASFSMLTERQNALRNSPSRVTNSLGMALIQFQPQSFVMGAPRAERGQRAHEIQRTVDFDRPIYVSTHEVTEAAFALSAAQKSNSKLPAVNLSWDQAAEFCNWLSQREALPQVYSIRNGRVVAADLSQTGYRLPTEAEWEWLAKSAGKNAPSIFVWGNQYQLPDDSGNLADISAKGKASVYLADYSDGFSERSPIGSFPAERSGLFDMVGNVSEWVHDGYTRTPVDMDQVYTDYTGPPGTTGERVIKGSNYLSQSWTELRASMRLAFRQANETTGFRVARYVYQSSV